MSKIFLKSKTSSMQLRLQRRRKQHAKDLILKPYDFCCSINNVDPLTQYDRLRSLYRTSLISLQTRTENPTLKLRAEFTDCIDPAVRLLQQKKSLKNKQLDIGDHRYKNKKNMQIFKKLRKIYEGKKLHKSIAKKNRILDIGDDFEFKDLHDKKVTSLLQGPLHWYLEDEIAAAKDILWEQKQRAYNEKMNKNIEIGKEKIKAVMVQETHLCPRWYQDFSINQIKNLRMLQCIMHKDCKEMVTGRTRRTLLSIGIISTFFTLTPDVVKKLQETCNCNVIEFLREIYKILTGNYFEEEGYKNFYDCNERIILSAIAFLTLPETIIELHKRLPSVTMPKLPSKPIPPILSKRQKMELPYKEKLFLRPDWVTFYSCLQNWQEQRRQMSIPNVILPPKDCILSNFTSAKINSYYEESKRSEVQNISQNNPSIQTKHLHNISIKRKQEKNTSIGKNQEKDISIDIKQKNTVSLKEENNLPDNFPYNFELNEDQRDSIRNEYIFSIENNESQRFKSIVNNAIYTKQGIQYNPQISTGLNVPPLYGGNRLFDFTINGIGEKPGPVEYKICGVLQPPQSNKKSWLDEKHAHYIISGASDEPPTCPVTYEMTGVANVTPSNSDERFFAVLKLGDGPKKIYPSGRQNLSRHWQEWLQNVDEEFRKIEREANKMVKSIEAITKLVFPEPTCDSCCSCRQTRKSYLKAKETKAPYFVIDTITEDDNKKKYIVGSMAMHSPAPTPPESTMNLLEVIASEDVLTDNIIISGVTNETGETQYFITGSQKQVIHMPQRVVEPPPPRPPRNVPPCVCAIQQMFSKGLSSNVSHDNIPWTKDEGLCFGKKFRLHEPSAYSCKNYPGDKSCRRNPFIQDINKLKKRTERAKEKQTGQTKEKKKIYSIADFKPCGDEHGMNICGGPWGALHTLTPEELAEQERLRKEILKSPPCGTKPGRAVCEGPFGERIRFKSPRTLIEEEIPGEEGIEEEEEEIEEEEEELTKPSPVEVKKKEKKRDKKCYMSPEAIEARRQKVVEKKVKKFIPDPSYPGYDDPWNIFRTAPSVKESETDFKKLLKLSSPRPPATPVLSKVLIDESGKSALHKDITKSDIKKDRPIVEESKKISSTRSTSEQIWKKKSKRKLRSEEKISERRPKKSNKKEFKKSQEKIDKTKSKLDRKIITKSQESEKDYDQVIKSDTIKDKRKDQSVSVPVKSKHDRKMATKSVENPSHNPKYLEKQSGGSNSKKSSKETSSIKLPNKPHNYMRNVTNYEINKQDKKGNNPKKLNPKFITLSDIKKKKINKQLSTRKRSIKRDRKKYIYIDQDINPETAYKNKIHELKNMMKSTKIYPYDIKPAEIPDDPPAKCQLEYEDLEPTINAIQIEEDTDVQPPSKDPCGWKTKSEQQLSTKKTLVYLTDPDYPPETIPVRPGGKPCVCRENRAKKKILLYNIGGLIGGKKNDEEKKLFKKKKDEDKQMQVIDGVIYYTPPPSPRRSDEYVPEYDLCKSPYDMCLTQRKDRNLKFLERYSKPKISEVPENKESCGCNEYIDTYGIQGTNEDEKKVQLLKEPETRDKLISTKQPKERWNLALKDVDLIDYFTRCRDSLPCWLKCGKFNRVGCPVLHRKLKTKRPVCECKYERKILEHKEEKTKWKERQKRLKSLKKRPYVNVSDISKPLVPNTKLMISEVKRIPREDEYIDDIKYCITGVAENYDYLPPKQVVGGIHMATPIQTPEPSEHEIPCICLHRHWSPMKITPGPLPKPEEILLVEKKRRQEAVKEAFHQIYAPQSTYHMHNDHGCQEKCGKNFETENNKNTEKNQQIDSRYVASSRLQKPIKDKVTNSSQRVKQRIKSNIGNTETKIEVKNLQKSSGSKIRDSHKEDRDFKTEERDQKRLNVPQRQAYRETKSDAQYNSIELDAEKAHALDKETEKDSDDTKCYLMAIIKIELKKMAAEGFLFAKLPKCFLMPQLRYWIMYRKGFNLSYADKKSSVRNSIKMWNIFDKKTARFKINVPSLKMTKIQLRKLTYDDAREIKEKIALKKATFCNRIRKERVLYARSMWNLMEYGKFPSISFKRAYFTYMAGKESDGHVFKPWLPIEVRDMTIK